jgi:hypothetical protein
LTGLAWAVSINGPGRLSSANIDNLTKLAGAFTKENQDMEYNTRTSIVEAVATEVIERGNDLLPKANIHQIATLAGAFKRHPNDETAEIAIEALALEVTARRDDEDFLPRANIGQIATLAFAFSGRHDSVVQDTSNFEEVLALQVTTRGDDDDFLPKASPKQLTMMKAAFSGSEELDYPGALAKVVKETAERNKAALALHNSQRRPQPDYRDRFVAR